MEAGQGSRKRGKSGGEGENGADLWTHGCQLPYINRAFLGLLLGLVPVKVGSALSRHWRENVGVLIVCEWYDKLGNLLFYTELLRRPALFKRQCLWFRV